MAEEQGEDSDIRRPRRKPQRKKQNPIEAAIHLWYEKHAEQLRNQHDVSDLVAQAPKRWTAYGPLVLLPAGSFTTPAWRDALSSTTETFTILGEPGNNEEKAENDKDSRGPLLLWKSILNEISGSPIAKLTHLAINEGIPLHSKSSNGEAGADGRENILRSPGGLCMLYGDFGPSTLLSTSAAGIPEVKRVTLAGNSALQAVQVTQEDFSRAFWVSTKQNGIMQIWAPRWTMFSRGNIKEKARLLGFHHNAAGPRQDDGSHLSHRVVPVERRKGAVVVDLYAGIGYFAFCYASLGFRVFCWELNPWSVEGLRRGAEANGWSVKVVVPSSRATEAETDDEEEEEDILLRDILAGNETIVVFLEDNMRAAGRIRRLDELTTREREQREAMEEVVEYAKEESHGGLRQRDVMHVNCGLLPSSEGSWETAWDIASQARQVWFHIHENVGASDIDARKERIQQWFAERVANACNGGGVKAELCVEHVEMVKTFAPGVWHCVFDLYAKRCLDKIESIT